jgi:uncharacterized membrane protein
LAIILMSLGEFRGFGSISGRICAFLALSGLATGASWVCYFRALKLGHASQVAPIDKLSVVLVAIFGVIFLGGRKRTELARCGVDCQRCRARCADVIRVTQPSRCSSR